MVYLNTLAIIGLSIVSTIIIFELLCIITKKYIPKLKIRKDFYLFVFVISVIIAIVTSWTFMFGISNKEHTIAHEVNLPVSFKQPIKKEIYELNTNESFTEKKTNELHKEAENINNKLLKNILKENK